MPPRKPDALDVFSDAPGRVLSSTEEHALALLEDLDAYAWKTLNELAFLHVTGRLSYAAWKTAVGALLLSVAEHRE